ncbi:MAG TPA: cation-efflux pump [Anaerolineaceae bacterium]|nr:cation-efflux pump [Anaerolineaceae bacterium]
MSEIVAMATAEREKRLVALSSVAAAIFITSLKLVIGLLTHSLGILAEAAHSGLDLVAAAVTFLAVRISDRPPDQDHLYGHGKVENLSALFEAFLLLITCVWIIYEAIDRLFFKTVHVEVSMWSFVVMGTSIIVDISRSRALMRMAKKHGSQALEADALHFSTDVWSSTVVIAGLILVTVGEFLQARAAISATLLAWLYRADALAALGVSGIVIYVSLQLGKRTVEGLLDAAPKGMRPQIEQVVGSIPGVASVSKVRVRTSGPVQFVDVHLSAVPNASLEEAHAVASQVEKAVKKMYPRADVIVHVEPSNPRDPEIVDAIHAMATAVGLQVHEIKIHEVRGGLSLEMHVEVLEELTLLEAHTRVSELEEMIRKSGIGFEDITTHIEPLDGKEIQNASRQADTAEVVRAIQSLSQRVYGIADCHAINVHRDGQDLAVSFHCVLSPEISVRQAHQISEELENILRGEFMGMHRVTIHTEPVEKHAA